MRNFLILAAAVGALLGVGTRAADAQVTVNLAPANYETPFGYNGTGWHSFTLDASNNLQVNCITGCSGGGGGGAVTAVAGAFVDGALATVGTKADAAYTGTGSATEIAIEKGIYAALTAGVPITSLPALPAGTNSIGAVTEATLDATAAPVAPGTATATKSVVIGCLANTTLPTFTAGQQGAVPCDASGRLWVAGIASNVPTYMTAQTSGGPNSLLNYTNGAGAVINSTVKSGAGQLFEVDASNSGSADAWCRLYNLVSDTTGSGTPFKVLYLPHGASPTVISTDIGISFGTGLTLVCTAGAAATDTSTITTANSVMVNMVWK